MGPLMTTFETTGPVQLTVELGIRSDIWITAVDRTEASVHIRPRNPDRERDSNAADQVRVDLAEERLHIGFPHLRIQNWFTNGGAVDVTIEVPIGSAIDVSSGMGSLDADGEFGATVLRTGMGAIRIGQCASLRAKTGQGDVTVGGVTGPAEITTGTGKVRVGLLGGAATVKNSNGETQIGAADGGLTVTAANGDIEIGRAAGEVAAKAANGAIRLGDIARGAITAATAAGSVEVGVRAGAAAWLDLSTKYGRVHNDLTVGDGPEPSGDTVQVRARSSYGDIRIHRSKGSEP
jgi:DUF4097 and DUF4098 domain-containing protein YvlB